MNDYNNAELRKGEKRLWVKLYIDFLDDPDLMEAGIETELLFVRALAWGKRKNDGFIARGALIRLGLGLSDVAGCVDQLTDRGLWSAVDNGWQITNWDEFQVSDLQLETKRAAGVLANHHRWHKSKPNADCVHCLSEPDPNRIQEKEIEKEIIITPDGFDEFWAVYPRKVGIGDARKAWKQTAKVRPDLRAVVAAVEAARAGWSDPKFIPYPASWLRGHRWADGAGVPGDPVKRAVRPCNGCIGTGRRDYGGEAGKEPCRDCGGSGKIQEKLTD